MTIPVEIRQEIQKRLQEIETYRSHYLYKEARIRCRELASFIQQAVGVPNKKKLLAQLAHKVKKINAELKAFSAFSTSVEMSPREQTVVHKLFTSGKAGSTSAAFEAATALLVFGQHAAALKAFKALLDDDTHRVAAAKNIIRCHLGQGYIQRAVNQYLGWLKGDRFPQQPLDSVRIFLQAVLTKKGYRQQLPKPVAVEVVSVAPQPESETETVDLLSIVLPYAAQRMRTKEALLDINFQSGKMINCIVPKSEKDLLAFLQAGTVFPDVQINGTSMITFCSVRLEEVSKIRVGPHAGDTTITMKVLDNHCAGL